MKCKHCDREIVSCRICGERFDISQHIKCESIGFPFDWEGQMHSHLDCGLHIASSVVIE